MHLSPAIGEPASGARGGHETSLLCRVGSSLCALPLEHVGEIMRILPVAPVANAPPYVRGVSIIRGTPTPVVDTALLCSGRTAPSHRLVTFGADTRIIALAVDSVLGVQSITTDKVLPSLLREAASEVVSAIGHLDADLLLFLVAARIVPEGLFGHLGGHETAA